MKHYMYMRKRILASVLIIAMLFAGIWQPSSIDAAKKKSIKKIALSKSQIRTLALKKGEKYSLKVKVTPNLLKKQISYKSSKSKVVSVNKKGKLTAKRAGKATITISSKTLPKKKLKVKVTVYNKFNRAKKVSLSESNISLCVGDKKTIKATVATKMATVKKVSYATSKKSVATISKTGVITAKAVGTTKITAYAKDGRGAKKVCKVTVLAKGNTAPAKNQSVSTASPDATKKPSGTGDATTEPTSKPSAKPTVKPTEKPAVQETAKPTVKPTEKPTAEETAKPTAKPTEKPTVQETTKPTAKPTEKPAVQETTKPTPDATPNVTPGATPGATQTPAPERVGCENMTIGGDYASVIGPDPFDGVALYANGDYVSTTKEFTEDMHNFTLVGCSTNEETAKVSMYIGDTKVGVFAFTGTEPSACTLENVEHGTGNQEIRLVMEDDEGTWDLYIDYLEIAESTEQKIVLANAKTMESTAIYVDSEGPAFSGLRLIADAISGDIEAVTGVTPKVVNAEPESGVVIVAGLVDEEIIENEDLTWKIEPSKDDFKADDFERYQIQVKEEEGKTKIIVAGADKRGTIYGMFHITQDLCGVSPWIWWADAKPEQKELLSFKKKDLEVVSKRPSVNYRGFFLNDEYPSLGTYANSHFGGMNYMFYSHVCELMLRLKGNYLWPAMWQDNFNLDGMDGVQGEFATLEKEYHDMLNGVMYIDEHGNENGIQDINALNGEKLDTDSGCLEEGDYPMSLANAVIADHYGVMVGASHHEPMARAGLEWGMFKGTYYNSQEDLDTGVDPGEWNYLLNKNNIYNFWSDAIARNGNFSTNIYTVGMRGESDSALKDAEGNELTTAENATLLKDVLRDQDEILDSFGQQNAPQVLAMYKEVENCWYGGDRDNPSAADASIALREDAEVQEMFGTDTNRIVMFCEDNNGYLRTLGEYGDKDKFNYGLYYHFDYVGGPHSYKWLNTMPLQRTWDNMTTAYEYGADDAWIVNVGDLKPMELPLSYFMDMAYDFETYGTDNPNSVDEYTEAWVEQQLEGAELSKEEVQDLSTILTNYADMNGDRRIERLGAETYSVTNYNEAQRHLAEAIELGELADKYLEIFEGTDLYDAYYQLFYYPAAQTANANKMWVYMGLNQLYAKRGSVAANVYAELVEEALDYDRSLTEEYNNLGETFSGKPKWYGMMVTSPGKEETVCGQAADPHFNYSSWNSESSADIVPTYVQGGVYAQLIVGVDGDAKGYMKGTATLPDFFNLNKEAYAISLSNGGGEYLDYQVSTSEDWIEIEGETKGGFYTGTILGVSVDWSKVTEDKSGTITITSGDQTVKVEVNAKVVDVPEGIDEKATFVLNGEASIVADNYAARYSADRTTWKVLEDYGKTGATLKIFPVYTDDFAEGEGPRVDYKVYVPEGEETGEYRLTVFLGQSNNISFDEGDHLNVGLAINGGTVSTKNTLNDGYVSGGYTGWDSNTMNAGHTMNFGTVTLNEGENTISIYGMDQNVMLQKLVLVAGDNAPKTSYTGPEQSYYAALGEVEQKALICDAIKDDKLFLPGTILAKDCTNDDITVSQDVLNAVPGTTYTYPVKVTADAEYVLGLKASTSTGATATIQVDEGEPLNYNLEASETLVMNEQPLVLEAGNHIIKLTVSDTADISSFIAEMYDGTVGRLLQVESTGGDADNTYKAVDRVGSTVWKPTESDPTLTLDFGEETYADCFTLSGGFSEVTGYKLEVSNDGNDWTEVYSAEETPVSTKIYFQGTKAFKGRKWRFSFTGKVSMLAEVQMNTYMNWTLEDSVTYTPEGDIRNSSDPEETKDGDRIGYPKDKNGWIANGGSLTVTMDYYARPMTGVYISSMQEAVDDGNNGKIPTDTLESSKAPNKYTLSYQKEDDTWVELGDVENNNKVLNYFEFADGEVVTVKAIKITRSSGWARVMEIEAVQRIDYTINGVAESEQNRALATNGGTVKSYTQADGSGATEQALLNDNDRISDAGNDTRVRFGKPAEEANVYVEVDLSQSVQLSKVTIVGQQDAEAGAGVEPSEETKGYAVAPVEIEYYDGTEWVSAGSLEDQGSGSEKTHDILRSFTGFASDAISNKVRLKYSSDFVDNYIRLIEVEVYGKAADMPLGLIFTDSDAYDIPAGYCDSDMVEIDLSAAVVGGKSPYTFAVSDGPAWLEITEAGVLSGTRPSTSMEADTAEIKVTDAKGKSKTITIAVGKIMTDPTTALTNFALDATITASKGEGNEEGGIITALNDGDVNYSNSKRWRTDKFPAWVEVDFGESKWIRVVDVIGQMNSVAELDKNTTTSQALKDIKLSYKDGEDWVEFATGDAQNQLVLQRFQLEEGVETTALRIDIPETCKVSGYARMIEIQAWGAELTNLSLDATVTASQGEGHADGAETTALNDGDVNYSNGARWRTQAFPAWVEVDFGESRTLRVVDVIGQMDSVAELEKDTTTTMPLKDISLFYKDGEEWVKFATGTADNTLVRQHFELDEAVETSAIRIEIPESCKVSDYARLIEIQAWGSGETSTSNSVEGLANLAPSATITASQGEGHDDGAETTALNDGDVNYNNGNRWRTNTFPAWIEVDFGERKWIHVVDVISQMADNSKAEGVYPELTEDMTTNIGLKDIKISYLDGENWVELNTGDEGNTYVLQRFVLDEAVYTEKIRIDIPETAATNNYARLIEVRTWGLTNLAPSATVTASAGEAHEEGATTTALNDGDTNYNNGKRWRTNTLPAWVELDLGETKTVSVVDVISQMADGAKVDGVYPEVTEDTTTTIGLKDIVLSYWDGEAWVKLDTGAVGNTLVLQRFELEEAVETSKLRIDIPSTAATSGWARLIEVQVWGD